MSNGTPERVELIVEGMSCGHCKAAVEKAVSALNGVEKVDVDLPGKKATIIYDADIVSVDDMKKAIVDQGYSVV